MSYGSYMTYATHCRATANCQLTTSSLPTPHCFLPLARRPVLPYNTGVMSYRSIKRVLGETSLERKCRFLFGACLLLLITASFWWYGSQTEKMVYQQNRNTGRLLVDQVMLIKHWESLETRTSEFCRVVKDLAKRLSKQKYDVAFHPPARQRGRRTRRSDEFERSDAANAS